MKQLTLLAVVTLFCIACNNAADQDVSGADTNSSLPAPATVDTNSLKPDSLPVERALRK